MPRAKERESCIFVYLSPKTKEQIKKLAKKEKMTVSTYVLRVLEAYINVINKK